MGLVKTFEETKDWKDFVVTLKIRAPNEEWAKKLVLYGFDKTMSYEDKGTHLPLIVKIEELKENLVKKKYVKNLSDGTYSPLSENMQTVIIGLVLTDLPDDGECVGEFNGD